MDAEEQELRRRLRRATQAHTPDRERMLARVQRGMTAPARTPHPALGPARRPAPRWLRVAGATAAVAGVFAAGGYGVAAAVRGDEPQQTVATTPSPDLSPSSAPATESPTHTPRPDRSSGPPTPSGPRTPTQTRTPPPPAQDNDGAPRTPTEAELVWADGSIDPGSSAYWGQSNVTVKSKKPLTALTVELRLAPRDQPQDTGNWRSLPAEDFDVTVRVDDGELVYRWVLKQGRTVPVGEHVFAAQYNHAEGERNADDDTYTIRAQAGRGAERDVWEGDFA